MSITDELRAWGDSRAMESTRNVIHVIANHIDAEHEREMHEQYTKGHEDGFWCSHNSDELAKLGLVKLPKDADGVPIHVGDKFNGYDKPITANRMVLNEFGWLLQDAVGTFWYDPANLRHVKPTVEDMLREFRDEVQRCCDNDATIAEYADRIRDVLRKEALRNE